MARGKGQGGFDMNSLLKQAQEMQSQMAEAQESLKDEVVEAAAGGGMVKVKITGGLELKSLQIDPEAIDPDDPDMLSDLILAAVNEAIGSAQELANSKMGGITGGLGGGPGGMPGGGMPGLPGM